MRILQAPVEVAGQVGLMAKGQRELGHAVDTVFPPHPFGYDIAPDYVPYWRKRSPASWVGYGKMFAVLAAKHHDVFHFHFGASLWPGSGRGRLRYGDARLLHRLGKKVVVSFWGDDVRLPSAEARRNPYYVNAYEVSDSENARRAEDWARITGGHVIVGDHSLDGILRSNFSNIHVVGQSVDTRLLEPRYPDPQTSNPRVVHAPSHKSGKGTEVVRQAVEHLHDKGLPFEYIELSGVSHRETLAGCAEADLVVDQLRTGSHGVFAAEAMALGKPVICYIQPELVETYPADLPIINANPDSIEHVLERWLRSPEDRFRRGRDSRAYAERMHDYRLVAARVMDAYAQLA